MKYKCKTREVCAACAVTYTVGLGVAIVLTLLLTYVI